MLFLSHAQIKSMLPKVLDFALLVVALVAHSPLLTADTSMAQAGINTMRSASRTPHRFSVPKSTQSSFRYLSCRLSVINLSDASSNLSPKSKK